MAMIATNAAALTFCTIDCSEKNAGWVNPMTSASKRKRLWVPSAAS